MTIADIYIAFDDDKVVVECKKRNEIISSRRFSILNFSITDAKIQKINLLSREVYIAIRGGNSSLVFSVGFPFLELTGGSSEFEIVSY